MDTAAMQVEETPVVSDADIVVAASSVIVPRRASIKKEVVPEADRKLPSLDDEMQRRGKRMMGVLLGTLQAPKSSRHSTLTPEQTQKKQQVDERLRQKLAEERAILEKTMEEEAQRRREAHLERERLERDRLEAKWTEHRALLQNPPFKRTETKPSLFWSPAM